MMALIIYMEHPGRIPTVASLYINPVTAKTGKVRQARPVTAWRLLRARLMEQQAFGHRRFSTGTTSSICSTQQTSISLWQQAIRHWDRSHRPISNHYMRKKRSILMYLWMIMEKAICILYALIMATKLLVRN